MMAKWARVRERWVRRGKFLSQYQHVQYASEI
jgi:hypothetical protein